MYVASTYCDTKLPLITAQIKITVITVPSVYVSNILFETVFAIHSSTSLPLSIAASVSRLIPHSSNSATLFYCIMFNSHLIYVRGIICWSAVFYFS